ncbi:MAG: trigger factor [Dehalococcoidia bacterium]
MKVTKEAESPTEVTLSIEMDAEDEDPFINRSYRRTVSRVQIPGFRKGKAPRSIVESYVGRTALIHDALDFMIPETLNQVLEDEELQAFMEPQIEVLELEPVSFKAVVPLEPEVELGDLTGIQVESEPVAITEEQVDEVIQRLQRESAPWEPADRAVQFGDLLNLNVKGTMAGEEVVNDEGVDYIPQLENVLPFPGFGVYLEGMAEGQDKEFTLTIPEDYPRSEYAGKDVQFQVEVLSVKEKILAELDDEFAKGVGEGYDDMEGLRAHVRERITDEAESQADQEFQEKIMESLLEQATINASDMLLQRELEMMREQREQALRNQRVDMETYLSYLGKTEEEFEEELRPNAEERLNRYLVLRKFAEEQGIEVTPEEIQEEVDTILDSSTEENAEAMRRYLSSESALNSIHSSIFNRRVMQRLTEIVKGTDGEAGAIDATTEQDTVEAEGSPPPEATNEIDTSSDPEATNEGAKPDAK